MFRRVSILSLALVFGANFACRKATVFEMEEQADVEALDAAGTPDAIAALGRLADTHPKALRALDKRAPTDLNAYLAAWTAVLRNAAWGGIYLRAGLADPARAELASRALPRRDVRVGPFVPDLEQAVVRSASSSVAARPMAVVLTSIGPTAHAAIERRLLDEKTRGAICEGIASDSASGDAKSLLLAVPVEGRDHTSCVAATLTIAAHEQAVLGWLAVSGEPGLLAAAGKDDSIPCPSLATLWRRALTERPPTTFPQLTLPLANGIKRCAAALDIELAEVLAKAPFARGAVVRAIDPFAAETTELSATCKELVKLVKSKEPLAVRERAEDAATHACRNAR